MCLRKILAREMEGVHKDITNKELAAAINVSPSTLSHFFSGNTEMCFSKYLKAVRYLCPDREKEVMWEIIQVLLKEEQRQPIRYSLEYLSTSNMINNFDNVICSQLNAPKENRDWAECYALLSNHKKGTLDGKDLLDAANTLRPKYIETKTFKKILTLYAYLRLATYGLFFQVLNEVEKEIATFKQGYIRDSFMIRVSELKSHAYLYAGNDTKKARFYAKNVLDSDCVCADFKYNSYYIVGMSYLFENFEQCTESLQRYVEALRVSGIRDVEKRIEGVLNSDIFFAKVLWGKELKDCATKDILESAHIKIKLGEKESAMCLLESYDKKDDPFYLCYLGLATDNPKLIVDSLTSLIGDGNKFLANIPAMYLKEYGAYAYIADSIMRNIKIA